MQAQEYHSFTGINSILLKIQADQVVLSLFYLVTAQVQGLPGVPPTGSDPNPNAVPANSQSLTPWTWVFATLALIGIGAAVATHRLALAHRKT